MPTRPCSPRPAFSLLELLIVVAIIAVLSALLLGAVQVARASAVRAECANHLRQIGLAMMQHHNLYRVFPSNGGWDGHQTILSTAGTPTFVTTTEVNHPPWHWGVGVPGLPPQEQTGCWAYALLPFVEQQAIYQERQWMEPVPLYVCPARRPAQAQVPPWHDEYGWYDGGGWAWGQTDYAANSLMAPNRPTCLSVANVSDGTSNTILVGEKSVSPETFLSGSWFWDEPYFTGGSGGTARWGNIVLADTQVTGLAFRANWGSRHPNGAQFVFVDGSVRTIAYGTDEAIVSALRTPSGNEVVPEF